MESAEGVESAELRLRVPWSASGWFRRIVHHRDTEAPRKTKSKSKTRGHGGDEGHGGVKVSSLCVDVDSVWPHGVSSCEAERTALAFAFAQAVGIEALRQRTQHRLVLPYG